MNFLPSGLPEVVEGNEELAPFINQSNKFSSSGPKPAAFLPNPKSRNTSVFRFNQQNIERVIDAYQSHNTTERPLKAVAFVLAKAVRHVGLEVIAEEPPPRHANIEHWPWNEGDLNDQKSRQKEIAVTLVGEADLVVLGIE